MSDSVKQTAIVSWFSNQMKCGEKEEEVVKQRVKRSSGLSYVTEDPEMLLLQELPGGLNHHSIHIYSLR